MTEPTPPLTALHTARTTLRTLVDGGLEHLVISPGSRSAPLAYAAAEAEAAGRLRLHVRVDERDAGFTALGLSLATGRPVAVATTSGTAVGELLPAVMEANHAGVPLVVLSADRPEELRGTGANQTTLQAGLFGVHVRHAVDIPAGEDPEPDVRRALLAADGITASDGAREEAHHPPHGLPAPSGVTVHATPPGPVHVNLAFRDPLVPGPSDGLDAGAGWWAAGGAGPADAAAPADDGGAPGSDTRPLPELPARRAVVVAGHDAGPAAERFARAHGLPLLAEPSSNARFGPNAIGPYRLLVGPFRDLIERVVVFGRPTLSRPVAALLGPEGPPSALYAPEPAPWFEPGRRHERIIEEPEDLARFAGHGEPGWLDAWRSAGDAATAAIREGLADRSVSGLHVARRVWEHARGPLVLGSSNPIRDADLAAGPGPEGRRVFANRGLAGIDGTVATAAGIALGLGERTTLLVGDLTLLHDAGGLLHPEAEEEPGLDIVVANDSGGAIFSTLEHGGVAEGGRYAGVVERLFGAPHSVDVGALAAAHGIGYVRVDDASRLAELLADPPAGRRIIDAAIDRSDVRAVHRRIADAVAAAVAPHVPAAEAAPAG